MWPRSPASGTCSGRRTVDGPPVFSIYVHEYMPHNTSPCQLGRWCCCGSTLGAAACGARRAGRCGAPLTTILGGQPQLASGVVVQVKAVMQGECGRPKAAAKALVSLALQLRALAPLAAAVVPPAVVARHLLHVTPSNAQRGRELSGTSASGVARRRRGRTRGLATNWTRGMSRGVCEALCRTCGVQPSGSSPANTSCSTKPLPPAALGTLRTSRPWKRVRLSAWRPACSSSGSGNWGRRRSGGEGGCGVGERRPPQCACTPVSSPSYSSTRQRRSAPRRSSPPRPNDCEERLDACVRACVHCVRVVSRVRACGWLPERTSWNSIPPQKLNVALASCRSTRYCATFSGRPYRASRAIGSTGGKGCAMLFCRFGEESAALGLQNSGSRKTYC